MLAPVDICQPDDDHTVVPLEPTTQVAFRFPDRLLARIDRHAKRLAKGQAGVRYTRADAVRDLVLRALDIVEAAVEADEKRGGGK